MTATRTSAQASVRRVFYLLTFTRWFPVGLVVGVMTLLPLERGLTITEIATASAVAAVVGAALELPTSGFADALGRKSFLVVAALVNLASAALYAAAHSFAVLVIAAALAGAFRALDSGPLEAWFVDATHAEAGTDADVSRPLGTAGAILGAAIAIGAVGSGALVWWHPIHAQSALVLPFLVWIALSAVHVVALLALMHEPARRVEASALRRATASARETPKVVADGLNLLRHNRILLGLVLVEVFWSIAMYGFENLNPIRMAELVGGESRGGAIMGPVSALGWAVFAAGSAGARLLSPRLGVARTAVLGRVLNGAFVVAMGVVSGPVGLVAAYLMAYAVHGGCNPVHSSLLHREADARNRSTVLSLNSMVGTAGFAVAAPLLGALAQQASTSTALVVAGGVSVLGAVFYLPAVRHERGAAVVRTT